jgi:hypothetical protein
MNADTHAATPNCNPNNYVGRYLGTYRIIQMAVKHVLISKLVFQSLSEWGCGVVGYHVSFALKMQLDKVQGSIPCNSICLFAPNSGTLS